MENTFLGYLFTCKICGNEHMLEGGHPHKDIKLPCVNDKYAVAKYEINDFEFWHGNIWGLGNIKVKEVKC